MAKSGKKGSNAPELSNQPTLVKQRGTAAEPGSPTVAQGPSSAARQALRGERAQAGGDASDTVLDRHGPPALTEAQRELWADEERLTPECPGRYEIKKRLGQGGIGRVLLAKDRHLDREVAIKELRKASSKLRRKANKRSSAGPNDAMTRTSAEIRLLREARVTGRLEHPSIIPVYELGRRDDGSLYYTMKVVRGQTLARALKGRDLRQRLELLPAFVDLCHAVAYAHSRGVIHRDLKPDNVMLGDFGETVVLDWGLAKEQGTPEEAPTAPLQQAGGDAGERRSGSGSAPSQTQEGMTLGTPAYVPPEQAVGELSAIDERSDVYALGAVLYQILVGKPPFTGESVGELVAQILARMPTDPRQLEPSCPEELAAVAMHAMRKKKEQRYGSAMALAQDVLAFQAGGLVGAHRYSTSKLVQRYLRRHAKGLGVAALLLITVAVAWWYRGWREQQAEQQAEQQRVARVVRQVDSLLRQTAQGGGDPQWFEINTFKIIGLKEPAVERRLLRALTHPSRDVRRLAARSLGAMRSHLAVTALCRALRDNTDPQVQIDVIGALGMIGDRRAEEPVRRARLAAGRHGYVWRRTEIAYQMIPLPPLPSGPVDAETLHGRAVALRLKERYEEALKLADRAIAARPSFAAAYGNRALIRSKRGDLKGARADAETAVQLAPKDPRQLYDRALIKRRLGDLDGALADLTRVIAEDEKERHLALLTRGQVYHTKGQRAAAMADVQRAIDLAPDMPDAHHMLGMIQMQLEHWNRALASFDRALALDPSYSQALVNRAYVHQMRGDLWAALPDLDRALALDPQSVAARRQRANVRLMQDDVQGALADLNRVIQLRPRDALPLAYRAVIAHAQRGQLKQALSDMQRALTLAKKSEVVDLTLVSLALALALRADQQSAQLIQALVRTDDPREFESGLVKLVHGETQLRPQLAELATQHPVKRCMYHLALGVRALMDGKRERARAHFADTRPIPRPNDLPCVLARTLAKRLSGGG